MGTDNESQYYGIKAGAHNKERAFPILSLYRGDSTGRVVIKERKKKKKKKPRPGVNGQS